VHLSKVSPAASENLYWVKKIPVIHTCITSKYTLGLEGHTSDVVFLHRIVFDRTGQSPPEKMFRQFFMQRVIEHNMELNLLQKPLDLQGQIRLLEFKINRVKQEKTLYEALKLKSLQDPAVGQSSQMDWQCEAFPNVQRFTSNASKHKCVVVLVDVALHGAKSAPFTQDLRMTYLQALSNELELERRIQQEQPNRVPVILESRLKHLKLERCHAEIAWLETVVEMEEIDITNDQSEVSETSSSDTDSYYEGSWLDKSDSSCSSG